MTFRPTDIADVVASGYNLGLEGDTYKAITGEPFVTICIGGVTPEGEPSLLAWDEDQAARELIRGFEAYKATKPGSWLYWRLKPQLEQIGTAYYARMRLLISEKGPPITQERG